MLLLDAVRLLELAVFLALAGISVGHWHRRRTADSVWLALTFVILGTAVVAGRFLPSPPSPDTGSQALVRTVVSALALFPYCLFRLSTSFSIGPGRRFLLARTSTAVLVMATAVLPLPVPGGAVPWWFRLHVLAFAVDWTVLSVVSARCLWRAGRGHPAVARRRMRTLGVASLALNAGLLLLAAGRPSPPTGLLLIGHTVGLSSAVLFLIAFAPPRLLRTIWRREDMERLHVAEADLMAAASSEAVTEIVLPQAARMVGARVGVFTDGDGCVVARHGRAADGLDAIGALATSLVRPTSRTTAPVVSADLIAVPVRSGWLALGLSASTPFTGPDELVILQTLGHLMGLALDRAELFDRDRAARKVLAEREAQLAEAQRMAQLGSYTWDLTTNQATWSAEMYRVLGYTPGQVEDFVAAFAARVHPEDKPAVLDAWAAAQVSPLPTATEYRIALPDGTIRWVHGRIRPRLDDDGGAPTGLFGTLQDITERKVAEEAIAFQAMHDALTRLPNRSLFLDRLAQALARRARRPGGLAVLFLDLDRFKWLNDSRGHAAGDELLVTVAERLRTALRPGDTVARFGGDEFVMLCEDLPGESAAESMAVRISSALAEPLYVRDEDTSVTVSIGIAYSPASDRGDTPETLLRDADAAMYQAKERGRDRYETFSHTTRLLAVARHETANALRRGIDRGELVVHYQPEVDITTNEVVGVEALVRWAHPERGLLPPAEFVPLAEETGLIVPLGVRVLHDACRQVQDWQPRDRTKAPIALSVNLAARQLMAPDLCDVVRSALEASGLDPSLLCLEITESALLKDAAPSARALHGLKALGVRIGVDDFGTGFSSLTYLKRFPVDVLKIDRSFVKGLGRDREDRAIVASVVDLAHAFGLTTVAEGVETVEQLAELRSIGCEQGQGFLWSRPAAPEDARRWIAAHGDGPRVRPNRLMLVPAAAGRPRHRLLIVDDDRRARGLLRILFESDEGYEVVGEADDGREAIAMARHLSPDVVLLDLAMPGMGGLEALPLILAVAPMAKVAVLSALDEADVAEAAFRQGAVGYVTKDRGPERLLDMLTPLLATA